MRRHGWRRAGLTAFLVAGTALALAGCNPGAAGASTSPAAPTVPSGAFTPTITPALSPTASPTPTVFSQPCQTSQLTLTAGRTGAALGHLGTPYQFTNTSPRACSLKGFASVRAPGHTIKLEQVTTAYMWLDIPINTIELEPSSSAFFMLQTDDVPVSGYQCFTTTLIIYPPHSSTGFTSPYKGSICDGTIFISPLVASASQL